MPKSSDEFRAQVTLVRKGQRHLQIKILILKSVCNSPINSTGLVLSSKIFIKHEFFNIYWI